MNQVVNKLQTILLNNLNEKSYFKSLICSLYKDRLARFERFELSPKFKGLEVGAIPS